MLYCCYSVDATKSFFLKKIDSSQSRCKPLALKYSRTTFEKPFSTNTKHYFSIIFISSNLFQMYFFVWGQVRKKKCTSKQHLDTQKKQRKNVICVQSYIYRNTGQRKTNNCSSKLRDKKEHIPFQDSRAAHTPFFSQFFFSSTVCMQ